MFNCRHTSFIFARKDRQKFTTKLLKIGIGDIIIGSTPAPVTNDGSSGKWRVEVQQFLLK